MRKPNKRNEVEMLEESYRKGDNRAIYNLGWCYLLGANTIKDEEKAVEYFKKGALLKDPKCMLALAICYRDGEGISKDLEKMIYWLKQGTILEDIDCIYQLAYSYDQGLGVNQDQHKAIELMQEIASYHKEARKYLKQKGIQHSRFADLFKRKSQ